MEAACATPTALPATELLLLRGRVRSEFLEMPGLVLTRTQAGRLFGLEPDACEAILAELVGSGFLKYAGDRYLRIH